MLNLSNILRPWNNKTKVIQVLVPAGLGGESNTFVAVNVADKFPRLSMLDNVMCCNAKNVAGFPFDGNPTVVGAEVTGANEITFNVYNAGGNDTQEGLLPVVVTLA